MRLLIAARMILVSFESLELGLGRQREKWGVLLTFGRDASADLDIGFFYDHSLLDLLSAGATILGGQHPFAISVSETINRDHTYASLIVAAIARPEAYAPSSLEKQVSVLQILGGTLLESLDDKNLLEAACQVTCSAPFHLLRALSLGG